MLDPSALEGQEIAFYREGAWYEPRVFARALLDRASNLGTSVHARDPVTAIRTSKDRITEVRTSDGRRLSAGVVVNCTGPQAPGVAALAGVQLALRRIPGLVVITTPAPLGLRAIVSAADLHARPHGGDRVLLHSWPLDGELGAGPTWPNTTALALRLLSRAQGLLPGLDGAELQTASVGVRPVPADGLPIVGFLPGLENLYAVVAHSAVHLAPVLGRLAAHELTGCHQGQLEPFRPTRLLSSDDEREVADESTRAMLAEMRTTS